MKSFLEYTDAIECSESSRLASSETSISSSTLSGSSVSRVLALVIWNQHENDDGFAWIVRFWPSLNTFWRTLSALTMPFRFWKSKKSLTAAPCYFCTETGLSKTFCTWLPISELKKIPRRGGGTSSFYRYLLGYRRNRWRQDRQRRHQNNLRSRENS